MPHRGVVKFSPFSGCATIINISEKAVHRDEELTEQS